MSSFLASIGAPRAAPGAPAHTRAPSVGVRSVNFAARVPCTFRRGGFAPRAAAAEDAPPASEVETGSEEVDDKSSEYNDVMNERMGSSLTYRHEAGINYNRILDDLIVGSCLQTPRDVDLLAEKENVGTVLCLQQDSDMEYFGLDIKPIQARCKARGDIKHLRLPINDFDPYDVRRRLPDVVRDAIREHDPESGALYVHCTAGMGRAPATALAIMYWLRGFTLEDAFEHLREQRACNPALQSIRQATADMLYGGTLEPVTVSLRNPGTAESVQVAGLDVGWGQQLDMELNRAKARYEVTRHLPVGRTPFKFIIDGNWTYDGNHPTFSDGGNLNNFVDVMPSDPATAAAVRRLCIEGGAPTPEERAQLMEMIMGA